MHLLCDEITLYSLLYGIDFYAYEVIILYKIKFCFYEVLFYEITLMKLWVLCPLRIIGS